jgi:GTP-binding protein HflX
MSEKLHGDIKKLSASQTKSLLKLYNRKLDSEQLVSIELSRELFDIAKNINRRLALLVDREGNIESVIIGTREIIYLPDLGRYRVGAGRLRKLRLIFTDLGTRSDMAHIPQDIYTDLEKLRLDTVCAVKVIDKNVTISYAYNLPYQSLNEDTVKTEEVKSLNNFKLNFSEFIENLESELQAKTPEVVATQKNGAMLVGVYDIGESQAEASIYELKELARTAGVNVLGQIIQRKAPDPKTLVGKGKLEQLVLESLRIGAEMIIFDTELKPSQWRAITNATEMKVIDRSMLILDIFAQRATSSAGRLQVELAQLKYNLPRLVEKDAGLSRLTGGIGGRGPGETKLEIGRRRIRDRITKLEEMIESLSVQRQLRRKKRQVNSIPLVAILGYTNAGKSTLFNALASRKVLSEDKLFATLDPTQARLGLPFTNMETGEVAYKEIILTDTVGFIRKLPDELVNAFRSTLEEINQADLLLHVMDASDPDLSDKYKSVINTITDLELADIPKLEVLNKIDAVDPEQLQTLINEYKAIPVSAVKKTGFQELKNQMALSLSVLQTQISSAE